MLFFIFQDIMSEEETSKNLKKKVIEYPSQEFETKSRKHDLNSDEFFKLCALEIDKCDIPMRNVLRDLITEDTHSFDKISNGVKMLWLMYHYNKEFVFPTRYFGANCYKLVVDISKDRDIYLYDDANIMEDERTDMCTGCFTDYHTGTIVQFGNDRAYRYVTKMRYY